MASNSKRASSLQLIMIWLFGVNKTNQDLWLSDHPVVRKAVIKQMRSSGRGLMSPGVRVHFPISPKLELLICDPMFYEEARILDGTVIETTENDVLRSNLVQAVHALSVDLIAKMVHWKIKELSSNLRGSPYQQVRKILHWDIGPLAVRLTVMRRVTFALHYSDPALAILRLSRLCQ